MTSSPVVTGSAESVAMVIGGTVHAVCNATEYLAPTVRSVETYPTDGTRSGRPLIIVFVIGGRVGDRVRHGCCGR